MNPKAILNKAVIFISLQVSAAHLKTITALTHKRHKILK